MLEDRLTEDSPHELMEVTLGEDELEQVVAIEEHFKQRLSKVNLTLEVPLVGLAHRDLLALPCLQLW